jgi:hypothetical protein
LLLAVDALGVDLEKDVHGVAGPSGDLRRRDTEVEPLSFFSVAAPG